MRVDEGLVKNGEIPLKTRPAPADEEQGMADLDEGIVELYAEHLSRKAASIVVTMAVGGAIGGAVLGTIPGLLSHSLISPSVNYFAVLLGAIAGGFLGRSLGEKRAIGYRLQAKLALHQAEATRRIVPVAARPAAPAPAPVAAALLWHGTKKSAFFLYS